jgi:hypothetical protein
VSGGQSPLPCVGLTSNLRRSVQKTQAVTIDPKLKHCSYSDSAHISLFALQPCFWVGLRSCAVLDTRHEAAIAKMATDRPRPAQNSRELGIGAFVGSSVSEEYIVSVTLPLHLRALVAVVSPCGRGVGSVSKTPPPPALSYTADIC